MGRSDEDDLVSVSSVVYNLAGSVDGRVDFLKSLIVGAMQKHAPVGDVVVAGYQKGPGLRYRNYARWAQSDQEFLAQFGSTSGKLRTVVSLDPAALEPHLPLASGEELDSVASAAIREARLHYWVLKYMYENYPDPENSIPSPPPFTGRGTYRYDSLTNTVTITDGNGNEESFAATGYDPDDSTTQYLYAKFVPCIPASEQAYTPGDWTLLAEEDPDPTFPSPWLRVNDGTAGTFEAELDSVDERTSTFSDGRTPIHQDYPPVVVEASGPTSYVHYVSDTYGGVDSNGAEYSIRTHKEYETGWEVDSREETSSREVDIGGGVIRTDTTTRTTEYLKAVRRIRISEQTVVWKSLLPPRWFIYRYGSGNAALDALLDAEVQHGELEFFYPPIPFRIDNKTVGPPEVAGSWSVDLGDLGFDWNTLLNDILDVQVANGTVEQPGRFVSVLPGTFCGVTRRYVRARDREARKLAKVLGKCSADSPGVFRMRDWDPAANDGEGGWMDPGPVQAMVAEPLLDTGSVDPAMADIYKQAKRGFKKAYDGDYDKVLDSVEANPNILDIDYAYAVFGVTLNTKDDAGRKYIYRFLQHLLEVGGATEADEFTTQYHAAHWTQQAWKDWWKATHAENGTVLPLYTMADADGNLPAFPPEPTRIPYPQINWKNLKVESVHEGSSNYRTRLSWAFIDENRYHGVLTKPEGGQAGPGELFFRVENDPFPVVTDPFEAGATSIRTPPDYALLNNQVTLNWQVTKDSWQQLVITGLSFENEVYKEHPVSCTAKKAVTWTNSETDQYEESPFIFPLNAAVFREMSIRDATQMAGSCAYLVFNCHTERVKRWYESSWFRVVITAVIVVAAIAAAIASGGASLGAAGVFVGGVVSGGAAVGSFGVLAAIAGALADLVVGLSLSYLLNMLSAKVFGEKWGGIIGGVLTLVLGGFAGAGFDPAAVTSIFATGPGLISLGMALSNGVASWMTAEAQEIQKKMIEQMAESNRKLAELHRQFEEEFGNHSIDPARVSKYVNEVLERPDAFLSRTLATGSDRVEETLRQVSDFVADRLRLELA